MKILFFGDSITDAFRNRDHQVYHYYAKLGSGYVNQVASELLFEDPTKYEVFNLGISGNRSVDLYARVSRDVWAYEPDVVSILVGVNDVWHKQSGNGVELERYRQIYKMLIEDTIKNLPNAKIMILEPFILEGTETITKKDWIFEDVYKYASVAKEVANEFNLTFVPLQSVFNEKIKKYDAKYYSVDGVHPTLSGATVIAKEWIKAFKKDIEK